MVQEVLEPLVCVKTTRNGPDPPVTNFQASTSLADELKGIGFTTATLMDASGISEIELLHAGFRADELKAAGCEPFL